MYSRGWVSGVGRMLMQRLDKRGESGKGTVQENGFNAVISDDFSKMFQNATK